MKPKGKLQKLLRGELDLTRVGFFDPMLFDTQDHHMLLSESFKLRETQTCFPPAISQPELGAIKATKSRLVQLDPPTTVPLTAETERTVLALFKVLRVFSVREDACLYTLSLFARLLALSAAPTEVVALFANDREKVALLLAVFRAFPNNPAVAHVAAKTLALCALVAAEPQEQLLDTFCAQLEKKFAAPAVFALKILFRKPELLRSFVQKNQLGKLVALANPKQKRSAQTVYTALHCLLLLALHKKFAHLLLRTEAPVFAVQTLRLNAREKVRRAALLFLGVLLRSELFDRVLFAAGLFAVVEDLAAEQFQDADLVAELARVALLLTKKKERLSAFEHFLFQLDAGTFVWDNSHSEPFLELHAAKFDCSVFGRLFALVDAEDPRTAAIAAHDLGVLAKVAKHNDLAQLNHLVKTFAVKEKLMDLTEKEVSEAVKQEALKALQNILLNNLLEFSLL